MMNDEQYLEITMGHLMLDDPETGEPLVDVDEETGEFKYELETEKLESKILQPMQSDLAHEEVEFDPETGECLTLNEPIHEETLVKTTFKIPPSYIMGEMPVEVYPQNPGKATEMNTESDLACDVVVETEEVSLLPNKKRRRSGEESESGDEATSDRKKAAVKDIRGKFGNNFLEGQAWPNLLVMLGLFILMPGFAIPLFMMVRLNTHYKTHKRLNPTIAVDDNEVLPCGLTRKEVGRYMILHTLLQLCRICREEYAGEKFARVHSDLNSPTAQDKNSQSSSLNLGGMDRISCCG